MTTSERWRTYSPGVPLREALARFTSETDERANRSWIERFSASGSFTQLDLASPGSAPKAARVMDMYFSETPDGRVRISAYVHEHDDRRALFLGQNAQLRFELFFRDKHSPDPDAAHMVSSLTMLSRAVVERAKAIGADSSFVRLRATDAPLPRGPRTEWREEEVSLRSIDSRDEAIAGTVLEVALGVDRDVAWTFVQQPGGLRLAKLEFSVDRSVVGPLEGVPELEMEVVRQRDGVKVLCDSAQRWTLASGADAFHPAIHAELSLSKPEPLLGAQFAVVIKHQGFEVLRFEVAGKLIEDEARPDPTRKGYAILPVAPLAHASASSVWAAKGGALAAVELGFHSSEALWLLVPKREGRGAPRRTNVSFVDLRKL